MADPYKPWVVTFATLALIAGLRSAWYWWLAAPPPPEGMDKDRISAHVADPNTGMTPVQAWLAAGNERNRMAAGWAAAAVIFSAISSIVSSLAWWTTGTTSQYR